MARGLKKAIGDYLRVPGHSVRLNRDDMEDCKMKVVKVAHDLLWNHNIGLWYLERPAHGIKGCKRIRWSSDATE